MTRKLLLLLPLLSVFLALPLHAQNECNNVPPNIAIGVTNERGNDQIVHQTICWNPATNTISIPSLAGGGVAFSAVTGGTNVAALIIGTGGSLTTSGTGTIVATSCPTCVSGTTFPINLPNGDATHPQLSAAATPADGFYIGAGFSQWVWEVGGAQIFAFNRPRGIPIGASSSICFAANDTLDNASSSNCTGFLSSSGTPTNTINFGSTIGGNNGTFNIGTVNYTAAGSLAGPTVKITNTNVPNFLSIDKLATAPNFANDDGGISMGSLKVNGTISGVNLSTVQSQKFSTFPACTAVGTAANPSLVDCGASSSGAFSCDVAASTGTCVISTTGVSGNSSILVAPSAAEGTLLGVTCNTAPTLVPTILLKAKSAAVSFTINMPTITVNPECFVYWIVN